MSTAYTLKFSPEAISFDKKVEIYQSKNKNNEQQYFIFLDGKLYKYNYDQFKWSTTLLLNTTISDEILYFPQTLENGNSIMFLKTNKSIDIYQYTDNKFKLLLQNKVYKEIFDSTKPGNTIKFGHFYYDKSLIGILSNQQTRGLELYNVKKNVNTNDIYPISFVLNNPKIRGSTDRANFFLADLNRNGQDNIIIRNSHGLNVYKLDKLFNLQHLLEVPEISMISDVEENFFFPDITDQPLKDIVLFNTSGLFLFQYKTTIENYQLIHYNSLFGKQKGWNDQYVDTVRFKDVNFDGKQEMFFTGPRGIDILTFEMAQWLSVLEVSQIDVSKRHSNIVEVGYTSSLNQNHSVIFTQLQNQLYWADIIRVEKSLDNDFEIELLDKNSCNTLTPSSSTPELFNSYIVNERDVLIRDQLDFFSIINGVDKNTGKANFKLPLIGLPSFAKEEKINFYYDGNNKDSNILGVGWSLPLSVIVMDHQGSIFPENERYYLIHEDFPRLLIHDPEKSTEDVYTFKLSNQESETRIDFIKKREMWEVVSSGIKRIYGKFVPWTDNALNIDLAWENWRGVGSSPSGQIELTTAWYLTEIVNVNHTSGVTFDYKMQNVQVPVSNKTFTRGVYLSRIRDIHGDSIKFNYMDKNFNEYTEPSLRDKQGIYNTKKVQTQYLAGFEVTTSNYNQDVKFIYKEKNGMHLLTEITQVGDPTEQPILQFSYEKMENLHMLKEVTLPTGAHVEFSYKIVGRNNVIDKKTFIHNIPNNYRIDYGHDFALISYFGLDKSLVLRIFDRELKTELFSTLSANESVKFPDLDLKELLQYQIKVFYECFAILANYGGTKYLWLVRKENNKWEIHQHGSSYKTIEIGSDFIVVQSDFSKFIEIIAWDKENKDWTIIKMEIQLNVDILRPSDKEFFIYDDAAVYVVHRNRRNDWNLQKIQNFPGIIGSMNNAVKRLGLEDDANSALMYGWKEGIAFQISKNFILITWWSVEENTVNSNFKLLTLNSTYEVVHEINDKESIEQELKQTLENDKKEEIPDYFAFLHSPVVTFVKKKYTFNGYDWKLKDNTEIEKKSWYFPIDEKFALGKENSQSSIKLYKQDVNENKNEILDLKVKNISQVLIKYPNYLVYQTENQEVNVASFAFLQHEGNKSIFVLPREETFSLTSNFLTLISHAKNTNHKENVTLIVRQFSDIAGNIPNPVITKLAVQVDDFSRYTGYDYDESSVKAAGDTLYYEKTFNIPGNNKFSFGWIEEINNITTNLNQTGKIYDARGNVIKIVRNKQTKSTKKNVAEETADLAGVLLDISGNLEVAQFYPYEIQDDEIGYYGFENYEVRQRKVGTDSYRWLFNLDDIVYQEFSLTGRNHLRLSNSRLLGEFQPRNQNQNYVASCWVRSPGKILEIDTITPFLQAVVYTDDDRKVYGFLSKAKFHYDDWNYLEVVIDLFYAKEILKNLESNSYSNSTMKSLKIAVTVSPGIDSILDVDHIRFSPLNSNFQATVYDFNTKEIKEIINSNGLIKRYLYNDYQSQIVRIDENGEIEELNSYTKSSSIHVNGKLKSKIKIKPNGGYYETFNPYSFTERLKVDDIQSWKIEPGRIHHTSNQSHQLKLKNIPITLDSYGIRIHFSLDSISSSIRFNNGLELKRTENKAVVAYSKELPIPINGEILLIVEHYRLIVWIDGGLYFDEGTSLSSLFDLKIYGNVRIGDMLVFTDPNVQVTYFNALGEKVQEINLESANSAYVIEYLYDELGRQSITTKSTRLEKSISESIVAYHFDFVKNKNPLSDNSVWKIHELQGEILKPYDYSQVTYRDNPLNEESVIGSPGREFSVEGKFAKRFISSTKYEFIKLFLNKHYPVDKHYRYVIESKQGGIEDITVYDNENNVVAWLLNVAGEADYLATYEYNDNGKLIQALSPLYHEKAGTLRDLQSHSHLLSNENNGLQHSLSVESSYNEMGNIINKTTPDSGKVECLYNDDGLLKFNIYYSIFNSTAIETVVYFDYDHLGKLNNTGKLISPPTKEKLDLALKNNLLDYILKNNTEEYQVFYQNDVEREPTLRGRLERSITYNDKMPFIEESIIDEDNNVVSKHIILPNAKLEEPLIITTNKMYRGGKLNQIEYPFDVQGKPFKITYNYDKLNRVKEIGVEGENNFFAEYTYNSNGLIDTEHHLPNRINSNFTRKYNYNSASFLTQLEDKFLNENIYYTEGSYSGNGYGDGTISRTEFKASWHDYADSSRISLNENSFVNEIITPDVSKLCFNKLKEAGYINRYNRQEKIYYPSLEVEFPTVCSEGVRSRHIQNILGKQGFPSKYGHLYDYGAYQELIKAKYFVGEEIPIQLQPDTFAQSQTIPKINLTTSRDIWNILTNSGYIIPNKILNDESFFKPYGNKGKSFIRSTLLSDLKNIDHNYLRYRLSLKKILGYYFSKKQDLSLIKFNLKKAFSKWSQNPINNEENKKTQEVISKIINMLEKKGYLHNPLDENFKQSLKKYDNIIPEIIGVLFQQFGKELGEAEFDVKAYEIDANGNHKHYYTGFERYKLKYRPNSNQIDTVTIKPFASIMSERSFSMKHDSRGNVIQAFHKGIKNITYHSVSNHATSIELLDGMKLIFYYDAHGERVLKRVLDVNGEVKKEISYVRDEFGRSLVEREITWSSSTLPPSILVTLFVYGPKGLIGFIRRDEYHSVVTDHAGSIRLVVKDGEVVAAYDYLPYGNLMRQYGSNSEAHISYRFTGQEWDEETGLYYYHARFYDPSIGRYYQHDPKMQYFSPYKYAGNSPVSKIDPNGEFAFLVTFLIGLAFGVVGGYLAGAAANHDFNPVKWNWNDRNAITQTILGFVAGFALGWTFVGSVAVLSASTGSLATGIAINSGIGLGGTYLITAARSSEWNPAKWNYKSPELWYDAYMGFLEFGSIPSGISGIRSFISTNSMRTNIAFALTSGAVTTGIITKRLSDRDLDFSQPGTYWDILDSIIAYADVFLYVRGVTKFFRKNIRKIAERVRIQRLLRKGYTELNHIQRSNSIFGSAAKLLGGIVVSSSLGILVSAISNEYKLDLTSWSNYESFVAGIRMVPDFKSIGRLLYNQGKVLKLKSSKNAKVLAKKAVEVYNQIKGKYHFVLDLYKLEAKILSGEIPRNVIVVAQMGNGKGYIAYSGAEGPGFLPSYYTKDILSEVGRNDVTHRLEQDLKVKRKILKEVNFETYSHDDMGVGTLFIPILAVIPKSTNFYFDAEVLRNISIKVGNEIKANGYIGCTDAIVKIILSPISERVNLLSELKSILKEFQEVQSNQRNQFEKLLKIEKDIDKLEQSVGLSSYTINRSQQLNEKIEMLNTRLAALLKKKTELQTDFIVLKNALNKQIVSYYTPHNGKSEIDILWDDKFKKYFDSFGHWTRTNCIAPQVISLRSLKNNPAQGSAKYTLNDIRYLGAYMIKQTSSLGPTTHYSNCTEDMSVKNIFTDPEWETMIAEERNKLKDLINNEGYYLKRSNFFLPYYDIIIEQVNNDKKDYGFRKKRSLSDNSVRSNDLLININRNNDTVSKNYENTSDYYVELGKPLIYTEEKSNNLTNNLFNWMKTSINRLLDTNKILPEKTTAPNTLKQITDSSNKLMAVTSVFDVNSTLLLLDTAIRKMTGQKYIRTADHDTSLLEATGYSLDIGLAFEKTMKYAASKSGISMHRFNIHYIDFQEKVIDKIVSGKLDEITKILISHAEMACPHRQTGCPGKLGRKKFEKFIDIFSKRIYVALNEIMQKNKNIKG